MAVSVVDAVDGLGVAGSGAGGPVGVRCRGGEHQPVGPIVERAGLHIADLRAGAGCPQVPIAQVIVVVVVVMVVDEVVHGGPLPAPALPGVPVSLCLARGAGEETHPHARHPVDLHELLAAFAGNVNQVLEEFVVAAARLRKAGEGAGVGQVAYPLLLHQLALALLRLGELRCYHHQAEVDHEERAHLRGQEPSATSGWPCPPHSPASPHALAQGAGGKPHPAPSPVSPSRDPWLGPQRG